MARKRSSPYPVYNLEKSIELMTKVYGQAKDFEVPINEGITAMGLSPDSSAGYRAVAALGLFGLLDQRREDDERKVKVSELGLRIYYSSIENGGKPSLDLLREAALNPDIIAYFWGRYSERGLPVDRVLKAHMLGDKEFIVSETAVNKFMNVFKDTVEYAGFMEDAEADDSNDHSENSDDSAPPPPKDQEDNDFGTQESQEFLYTLSDGSVFKMSFPSNLDERSLNTFRSFVNFVFTDEIEKIKEGTGEG